MCKVDIPTNCFFQGCYNPEFEAEIEKCKNKCREYNKLRPIREITEKDKYTYPRHFSIQNG